LGRNEFGPPEDPGTGLYHPLPVMALRKGGVGAQFVEYATDVGSRYKTVTSLGRRVGYSSKGPFLTSAFGYGGGKISGRACGPTDPLKTYRRIDPMLTKK